MKLREATVVAGNPRPLRDEDRLRIFILPPSKAVPILQAADVRGYRTLGGNPSYQGMSGAVAKPDWQAPATRMTMPCAGTTHVAPYA
jgi:hypothetical protein